MTDIKCQDAELWMMGILCAQLSDVSIQHSQNGVSLLSAHTANFFPDALSQAKRAMLDRDNTQQVELEVRTSHHTVQGQNLCFTCWKETSVQDSYLTMHGMYAFFQDASLPVTELICSVGSPCE